MTKSRATKPTPSYGKRLVMPASIMLTDGSHLQLWAVVEAVAWFRDEDVAIQFADMYGEPSVSDHVTEAKPEPKRPPKISSNESVPESVTQTVTQPTPDYGDKPQTTAIASKPDKDPSSPDKSATSFSITTPEENRRFLDRQAAARLAQGGPIDTSRYRGDD